MCGTSQRPCPFNACLQYLRRQHLADVTEIFRQVGTLQGRDFEQSWGRVLAGFPARLPTSLARCSRQAPAGEGKCAAAR